MFHLLIEILNLFNDNDNNTFDIQNTYIYQFETFLMEVHTKKVFGLRAATCLNCPPNIFCLLNTFWEYQYRNSLELENN